MLSAVSAENPPPAAPGDKHAAATAATALSGTGRGMRATAGKRKPLGVIHDNGQTLEVPETARSSLHTPAKPAGPVSAAAESPGLLRGFFAFLSPEQKSAAAAAAAAAQAADNTHMEQAAQTAIPLSESLDWASQDGAHAGAAAASTTALLPLSPPQLPSSNKTIEKSPMATLLSAMKPVAAAAATNAQPRSLASSFVPVAATGAAGAASYANLHAVLQPYASLLPPEMLSAAPPRSMSRKSDSALSTAGACSPSLEMLTSSASSPQPSAASSSSSRFVCQQCSKGFPSNSALSMHQLVHMDSKPFVCPSPGCSKAFRQKGHLISHHRKHTGEKPFICPALECAKRFKDKSGLNTHVKRQHPMVSCAHVTAVAPSDEAEGCIMDPGLAAAIARANVMLAEMQTQGAAAASAGEAAAAAAAAASSGGSSTPLPPAAAPRSRTVPGSTTPKNAPAATNAPTATSATAASAAFPAPTIAVPAAQAPAIAHKPAGAAPAAKKRSHSSLGLAAAAAPPSFSVSSPSPSSLSPAMLHLRRSLTPSLDSSLSSSCILGGTIGGGGGSDELELERLAGLHHHHSSMLEGFGAGATPSIGGSSSASTSCDAQVHPLMKRSRSESPALLPIHTHLHTHLPKLQTNAHAAASHSSNSFSPIPSPILFFNPASAAAAAAAAFLHTQQQHATGRSTPTSSSWLAQIPLPHASLTALYAAPQQHHSSASRSNAPSPSPHAAGAHLHLPPAFAAHSPLVGSTHSPQLHAAPHDAAGSAAASHSAHQFQLPMALFNSAASSAFSFKTTQQQQPQSQQQPHAADHSSATAMLQ